jgi:hypothetical protein
MAEQEPAAAPAQDYDQVQRLGIDKWKPGVVSKHLAVHDDHLRKVMSRLTAAGDDEAAETIAWLVWWRQLEANWKLYFNRELLKATRSASVSGDPST